MIAEAAKGILVSRNLHFMGMGVANCLWIASISYGLKLMGLCFPKSGMATK
jgi:hypothetical protein